MIAQRTCGSTEHQQQLLSNPTYVKWFKDYKSQVSSTNINRSINCSSPLIIPVAVHYNGTIDTSNPSCLIGRALDQVAVLNEDFGSYNSDIAFYCALSEACCNTYPPEVLSTGTCIQFCLASKDHPSCEPSNNLIGGYAITVGQHTWPTASNNCWNGYFNVFVSDVDPPGQMNLLGLAPIAGAANPNGNGMFIKSFAFGGAGSGCISGTGIDTNNTYNRGRTGTHEAGHYFGLDHIFDGCGNGDGIADTPDQSTENYDCPTVNAVTCNSNAENTCGSQDFFFNYMDYVNDICMFMFTENQSEIMYATALQAGTGSNQSYAIGSTVCDLSLQPDYDPIYPNGCVLVNPPIPESAFEPTAGAISTCSNRPVRFDNTSDVCAPTSWAWTFNGAGVTVLNSNDENPTIYLTQSGTLDVTLVTSNVSGPDPSPAVQSYSVTVIDSNDPACNDCGSTFTDSGGATGNYSNNEQTVTTLCSPLLSSITVDFLSFALEPEPDCMYDAMTVYDGPTILSNLIGTYCGVGLANAPGGGTVSSTDECLTFVFSSDVLVVQDGWEANITCSIVVPVELSTFSAVALNKDIVLEWEAASEINLKEYVVQRSVDGYSFIDIERLPAQGGVNYNSYQNTDFNLPHGKYYYRLKQNHHDGHFDYSHIVSSTIESKVNNQRYTVNPNPSNGLFTIVGSNYRLAKLKVTIYDRTGGLIKTIEKKFEGRVDMNLSELMDGVYTLRINDGKEIQMQSIVILQ